MSEIPEDDYGLAKIAETSEIAAPDLPYLPRNPKNQGRPIGLVGCGGIAAQHLAAYRHAGYNVVALCDRNLHKVEERRASYYPDAAIYTDYRELLKRDDIEVVDLLPMPKDRYAIIEQALQAGKHVLSQKPFVTDIDAGQRLVDLADSKGLKLAVNQNGRWAPHYSYIRQAIEAGLLGDLASAALTVHWDHSWIIETAFNEMHDLVLYDFAVHWFDILTYFFRERRPTKVYASSARSSSQRAKPPMLAQVAVDYEGAQATLVFNADVVHGQQDRTYVAGSRGTALSLGPSLSEQSVTLYSEAGYAIPKLEGTWFREGFHGTMAELLCAIEEGREPSNGARENLRSLELAFAAIASAHTGQPQIPGSIRQLPQ